VFIENFLPAGTRPTCAAASYPAQEVIH